MRCLSKTRCSILLMVLISGGCTARTQDVVIVANPGVQISEIKESDLRAIFTGEKTKFSDGSHAFPVVLRGGPVHEVFLKRHLNQSPDDFRALWRKAVFTGQGAMPKSFDSELALIEYIAATPGAIGYVSRILPENRVKSITALK